MNTFFNIKCIGKNSLPKQVHVGDDTLINV